jgi:spore maturation protein CgeB
MRSADDHPLRRKLAELDLVMTYGGGDPVVNAYRGFGARRCEPIYNALDPQTHFPVEPDPRFAGDLSFLANRLPDREKRVEQFFIEPAAQLPEKRFLIGGNGWGDKPMPANVTKIGHVGTGEHNAFNGSPLAVLNVAATRWPRSASRRRRACSRRRAGGLPDHRRLGRDRAVPEAGRRGAGRPRRQGRGRAPCAA